MRHSGPRNAIRRRQLLQVGTAGLLGLNLPTFLHARSAARAAGGRDESEKSCIFIVLSGGLSHIDTIDPKPHAPREIRGPYEVVPTATPGIQITEKLPELAKLSDTYCLVRSLSHTEIPHVTAAHMMLSCQMDGSRSNNSPFFGSLVSKFRPSTSGMPSYVWLHNMKTGTNKVPRYDSGLDVLGYEHAPMRIGYELDNPSDPDFRVREFDPPEGVTRRQIDERFALLEQIEPRGLSTSGAAADFATFQQKARELITGPRARNAFDLDREPDSVRERYGRHPLGQYTLMARRLIEAGVRLVTVTGWPGLAPGETKPTVTQVWDTHDVRYKKGDSMYGNGPFGMKWSLPRMDQAVSALLEDLRRRGLLDSTLVVLITEFGRTPKFEGKGRGRGHWPHCYSGLLAGGGIRGGAVYGQSDKQGGYVAAGRPVSPADFGATLFQVLGIPPETRFGPDGFSFRVSEGKPVQDLSP